MNNYWFYVGAIGSLAIVLTSCGDNKAANPVSPSPVVTSRPVAFVPVNPVAALGTSTTPTIGGKKSVPISVSMGTIASTNGDNWAKTVLKGRSDPFATLTLQPIEVVEENLFDRQDRIAVKSTTVKSGLNKLRQIFKVAPNPITGSGKITKSLVGTDTGITRDRHNISSIPKTGTNKALSKVAVAIKPMRSGSATVGNSNILAKTGNTNVLRPMSSQDPKSEQIAAKPLQAMAIEVSGVIEVEGKTQVIVRLPNELFSRYVNLGDRVANDTVLVKRVEAQATFSPTVILEEVGIEVARKIGEKLVSSSQSNPTPAAK
ncbi:hypothetical protein [Chamaesiphon sp.]|uniref:hypothetical protein n=1 Tax=Chamaesiphon sp. TaxID=2814140 RepID=UPI00359377F3